MAVGPAEAGSRAGRPRRARPRSTRPSSSCRSSRAFASARSPSRSIRCCPGATSASCRRRRGHGSCSCRLSAPPAVRRSQRRGWSQASPEWDEVAAATGDASRGCDRGGLAGLLAVHVGQHGQAEARDAPARRPAGHGRHLRTVDPRHRAGRSLLLGRADVPRVRPGQLTQLSDVGRRGRHPRGDATADACTRRGDRAANTSRRCSSASPRSTRRSTRPTSPTTRFVGAPRGVSGRVASRRDLAPLPRSLRRRDPRRHRLDRDDAHLPVESSRRGASWVDRRRREGLRGARRRRRRASIVPTTSPAISGCAASRRRRATTATPTRPRRPSVSATGGCAPATPTCGTTTECYTYLGRSDDMFRVGGEWVAPAEVEATIIEHPSVLEVAIVGEIDDRGITRPVAYVVAKPGASVTESEVIEHCRNRLAGFKRPSKVVLMETLPKTATGKIQRFKLRQIGVTGAAAVTVSPLRDFFHTESCGRNRPRHRDDHRPRLGELAVEAVLLRAVAHPSVDHARQPFDRPRRSNEWVNDGLMTIFFLVVGLEIKRELVEGELRDPRTAALPGDRRRRRHDRSRARSTSRSTWAGTASGGWGIPMATDIAMAIGVVSLLGSRVAAIAQALPARPRDRRRHRRDRRHRDLLLGLASTSCRSRVAVGFLLVGRRSLRWSASGSFSCTSSLGAGLWLALHEAGVHATLAGVILGLDGADPALPSARARRRGRAARHLHSRDGRGDRDARPRVGVGRRVDGAPAPPVDELRHRAAVRCSRTRASRSRRPRCRTRSSSRITLRRRRWPRRRQARSASSGASWIATRLRIGTLPAGATWQGIVGVGVLAGIGFTVSIFVAGLGVRRRTDPPERSEDRDPRGVAHRCGARFPGAPASRAVRFCARSCPRHRVLS